MLEADWNRILSIKEISSLTDDEIEDYFPIVIRCDVDEVDDVYNLRILVKLSQEILQYKDNQVESLLLECGELKERISTIPVKSQQQQQQQHQVTPDRPKSKQDDSKEHRSKGNEETVKKKNAKIRSLMEELETLEAENEVLKEKLRTLGDEMEDATEKMNDMTEELNSLRSKNLLQMEKIEELEIGNAALVAQIEELTGQQLERDRVIDEFSTALDSRVAEWKAILDERDEDIGNLREELAETLLRCAGKEDDRTLIARLNEELEQRERMIEELRAKLAEAALELNESAGFIERLKADARKVEKGSKRKEHRDLLQKLQEANERITHLQGSLRQTDADMDVKSRELCEALATLRKYEERDSSLAEALKQIAELRGSIERKNRHIEDLVAVVNRLETSNSELDMQICALREKLGIPEDEVVSTEDVARKRKLEKEEKAEMAERNRSLTEKNLELKSDIRMLRYRLHRTTESARAADKVDVGGKKGEKEKDEEMEEDDDDDEEKEREREDFSEERIRMYEDLRENARKVVEENEALRQGMHEILDSIRDQDGKSQVEVKSDILERLLEALDIRHLAGWYHPAMRLQERLNVVQGSNSELRGQVKHLRRELERKERLMENLAVEKSKSPTGQEEESSSSSPRPPLETVDASEMEKLQQAFRNEAEEFRNERELLTEENLRLRERTAELEERLETLERNWKILQEAEGAGEQQMAANFNREIVQLSSDLAASRRQTRALEKLLSGETERGHSLEKQLIDLEARLKLRVNDLEARNRQLEKQLDVLRGNLRNCVGRLEHEEALEKLQRIKLESRLPGESPQEVASLLELHQRQLEFFRSLQELHPVPAPAPVLEVEKEEGQKSRENLEIENDRLRRDVSALENQLKLQSAWNSLRSVELDFLKHQILDLQATSDDKETIARLGFELSATRSSEIRWSTKCEKLESEVLELTRDLEILRLRLRESVEKFQDREDRVQERFRMFSEVTGFLQQQYFGCTPSSTLDRFLENREKLRSDRVDLDKRLLEAQEKKDALERDQELLSRRLEVVERLKDILEQQIGAGRVQEMVQQFSAESQQFLNEFKYQRRIAQLERDLQATRSRAIEWESIIDQLEAEMLDLQRVWGRREVDTVTNESDSKSRSTQTEVIEFAQKEVQTEPTQSEEKKVEVVGEPEKARNEETFEKKMETRTSQSQTQLQLQEQLNQALKLASERALTQMRLESQLAESRAKLQAIGATLERREAELADCQRQLERTKAENSSNDNNSGGGAGIVDKTAVNSVISSLQKMVQQKEETVERYQKLLESERQEHGRLQAEVERLNGRIRSMQEKLDLRENRTENGKEFANLELNALRKESQENVALQDEIVRLQQRASTLEAEHGIAKDMADRWHRLAEERLHRIDQIRDRLEEQHKKELESYRLELEKCQVENDDLRQRVSQNRMELAKGSISLAKELQERENKIRELTIAYEELQGELEILESARPVPVLEYDDKAQDRREQIQRQSSQVESLRKQLQSMVEKEKAYKNEVAELKQQIGRRYMALKTQEKRVSQRELQLEKKVKSLEEELQRTKDLLNRETLAQEARKAKTAEELALWEKQKRWQQSAERLKQKLQEKCEEQKKLQQNYDKLRAVVACMEREKWYLQSRIKHEIGGGLTCRSASARVGPNVIDELQKECESLKRQVQETSERLRAETSHEELLEEIEDQRRRISALETLRTGNDGHVIAQLEKLEKSRDLLEKKCFKLESENFELRLELERMNLEAPRLQEKIRHLERYVELLKVEMRSPRSDKDKEEREKREGEGPKSQREMEKTIFTLKRIIERLQVENKRFRTGPKSSRPMVNDVQDLQGLYEKSQKRVVALEADLQLAEQRLALLERSDRECDREKEIEVLKQQLSQKSELLDRVKQLMTKAAANEKTLRQRVQFLESAHRSSGALTPVPECRVTPPSPGK